MKKNWVFACAIVASLAISLPSLSLAQPGVKIDKADFRWLSVGGGLRTSFSSVEGGAANGTSSSKDFNFEDFRLYIDAEVFKGIEFEFNTQQASNDTGDANQFSGDTRILDAIAKFRFSKMFNIWGGRHLPPSDRSLLDGPYFLNTFDFPFVSAYPNISAGRDDGVSIWGVTDNGFLKYQFGVYKGRDGGSNQDDSPLYTGRLTFNFWDPEPAIYYNQSTYYGAKDILSVGLVFMQQSNGVGTAINQGDFTGYSADFLLEKKLGGMGTVTLEAAGYDYETDEKNDSAFSGFSLTGGSSFFVLASYLLPSKLGWGRLQPHIRYQSFNRDSTNGIGNTGVRKKIEGGVNYIIDGHNARLALILGNEEPGPGLENIQSVKLGVQLQLF